MGGRGPVPEFFHNPDHYILDVGEYEPGWYWWYCFPGCLPDTDPYGPFKSEEAAVADWHEREENLS